MQEISVLALILALATALAFVVRKLGQPLLVAYVLVGALLSIFKVVAPGQLGFLSFLPEVGLALLLFLVGMELDFGELVKIGKHVIILSVGQTVICLLVLTAVLSRFGFSFNSALLAALAVSFSSTILVVKILTEEKEVSSMHGKLAVGVLLFEDLVAVGTLMFISAFGGAHAVTVQTIAIVVAKGVFLIWLAIFSGRKILPKFLRAVSESGELLFMAAIAWCMILVAVSSLLSFSIGIGAFLAGVSLAQSTYRTHISGKVKPLRDFFIMLFFVDLGTNLSLTALSNGLSIALLILTYAVVVKPVVFFAILALRKFRTHAAFQTALVLSSISEFSLILVFLASRVGLMDVKLTSPIIFATVVSFIVSSFLATHSRLIYLHVKNILKIFESKQAFSLDFFPAEGAALSGHAVLIGCHRSGMIVLEALQKVFGDKLVVVDFNPDVIEELKAKMVPCVYGDISDPEIQARVNLKEAALIVSTVRDFADNLVLLDEFLKVHGSGAVIVTASDSNEGIRLYERGAHHVSIPVNLEGVSISRLLSDYKNDFKNLISERDKKLGELKKQQI